MPAVTVATCVRNVSGTMAKNHVLWMAQLRAGPEPLPPTAPWERSSCLRLKQWLKALLSGRPSEKFTDTVESTVHMGLNTTGFKTQEAVSKEP